ncbi:EAL domain-containing protein [Bacillus sinesaloumensis]|uniref:EAL domain-containing protein n=1 Tax=Litchfieldia sinesaloumensis TaxID=1926280 RepID=UPI0009884A8F|nr:EAL domain-containing protein [Bacillus sinesaloumensis]
MTVTDPLVVKVGMYHEFQPIMNVKENKPLGFEALVRSNVLPNPAYIFRVARESGKLYEMDCASIQLAIETYLADGYTSEDGKLFLNILPSTILHDSFLDFVKELVKKNDLSNQEIILEISESEEIGDFKTFVNRTSLLKELDFKIAIDDCGSGYSDIKNFIELDPHYLKLDRYFSKELAACDKKVELIKSVMGFVEKFNSELILEGLEREVDLEIVRSMGIEYAQGYLLGRPASLKAKVVSTAY